MTELVPEGFGTPKLFIDNQSAIRLIKNPEFHKKTKHIDVCYHFIREKYTEKFFEIEYVSTDEQLADILTKPLVKTKHTLFCKMLGLQPLNSIETK